MAVMGKLLSGAAPLRGRANLELVLYPFPYRMAARYWGVDDPRTAAVVHAVVGGTPAYRRYVGGDHPTDITDYDNWVLRTVLDPGTPLFREGRYLLEEDVTVREPALYNSVLAAVALGNATRGGFRATLAVDPETLVTSSEYWKIADYFEKRKTYFALKRNYIQSLSPC